MKFFPFQLWTFNTQVCNASIYALRKEIQSLKQVKMENEMFEVEKDENVSFSETDFEDETSLFEEFDKALAEYEEDLITRQSSQNKMLSKEVDNDDFGAIDSLLISTNKLLQDIDSKYQRTLGDLDYVRNYTEKILNQNIEEKLTAKMSNLQKKYTAMLNGLKDSLISSDKDILQSIALRSEDYNMIRKTTKSRLSVYETRLDTLEKLLFEFKEENEKLHLSNSQNSQNSQLITSTTEAPSLYNKLLKKMKTSQSLNDYEDFAGKDFSMLGLSDPNQLDVLDETDCLFPPCSMHQKSER